jgi:hypothetical protein
MNRLVRLGLEVNVAGAEEEGTYGAGTEELG